MQNFDSIDSIESIDTIDLTKTTQASAVKAKPVEYIDDIQTILFREKSLHTLDIAIRGLLKYFDITRNDVIEIIKSDETESDEVVQIFTAKESILVQVKKIVLKYSKEESEINLYLNVNKIFKQLFLKHNITYDFIVQFIKEENLIQSEKCKQCEYKSEYNYGYKGYLLRCVSCKHINFCKKCHKCVNYRFNNSKIQKGQMYKLISCTDCEEQLNIEVCKTCENWECVCGCIDGKCINDYQLGAIHLKCYEYKCERLKY